jgi:hypothetical protein
MWRFMGGVACLCTAADCIQKAVEARPNVLPESLQWLWWIMAAVWAIWAIRFAIGEIERG